MSNEFKFDGTAQLESLANDPSLQADEKPLFAIAAPDEQVDDDDAYLLESATNGGAKARTKRLDGFKAVYNPESGRVFGAVTQDYDVINPPEFIEPLCEILAERGHNPTGRLWPRDDGARVYGRLLLDSHEVWLPGRNSDPLYTGFEFRWSHDGGVSVSAEGFAQDGACTNTMRRITDSVYVKHSRDDVDREFFRDQWESVVNQLGAFSDTLEAVVTDAMEYRLINVGDLEEQASEIESIHFDQDWIEAIDEPGYLFDDERGISVQTPFTERDVRGLFGLYDYLGLPNYLAVSAADRLLTRMLHSDTETTASAWDAYSAATWALSHDSRATPGTGADDNHHRAANDLLMNPPSVGATCRSTIRSRLAVDDDQAILIETEDDAGDAMRTFHERRDALQTSFEG